MDNMREFRRKLGPASAGPAPESANPDTPEQKSRPV
jgi:hypothetical protein